MAAGEPVKEGRELQTVVAGLTLNKPVDLTVIRDGKEKTLQVTVQEQPGDFGTARVPTPKESGKREKGSISLDKLGLDVTDLTSDLADELGYKESLSGALVTGVQSGGPAAEAGLRRGDIVVSVDGRHVVTATAIQRLMVEDAIARRIEMTVWRNGALVDVFVVPRELAD